MSKLAIAKTDKAGTRSNKAAVPATTDFSAAIKGVAKRGVDLGNGFVLIEVSNYARTGTERKFKTGALQGYKLPGIKSLPEAEIEGVFKRFKGRTTKIKGSLPKLTGIKPAAARSIPAANQAILATMAKGESNSIEKDIAAGKLISSKQMAERLGVKQQAVTKAIRDLRMFSLKGASGKQWIPAFFADPELQRQQLESVSKALGQLPGTSKWQFFTSPRMSLSKKAPVDALRKGKIEEVLVAAKAFAED